MTLAAVATTYLFGLVYLRRHRHHFFLEPPSRSPCSSACTCCSPIHRRRRAPSLDGSSSGCSTGGRGRAARVAGSAWLPTFYDKLLPVPILNLTIRAIDRAARSNPLKRFDPAALGRALTPRQRNLADMAAWTGLFVTMQAQTGTEATLALAESLKDQGRMTEAIARYREFVATDPEHFDGQRKLGAALLESGALNDALPPLERAVALQPKSAAAHYSLGFGLMQLRTFDRAEREFRQALALDPDYATAQSALGLALWASGAHDEADPQYLREGVRRWPTSAEAHYNLGAVLDQSRQDEEAMAVYSKAVAIDPSYVDAQFALGVIYAEVRGGAGHRSFQARAAGQARLGASPDAVGVAARDNVECLVERPSRSIDPGGAGRGPDLRSGCRRAGRAGGRSCRAKGQFERAVETAERMLVVLGSDADQPTIAAARDRLALLLVPGRPMWSGPNSPHSRIRIEKSEFNSPDQPEGITRRGGGRLSVLLFGPIELLPRRPPRVCSSLAAHWLSWLGSAIQLGPCPGRYSCDTRAVRISAESG